MVFDGFYITQMYGRWIPFRCASATEYFNDTGHLRVHARISPLVKINDLYTDCTLGHEIPIGNYDKIFKIKECYT